MEPSHTIRGKKKNAKRLYLALCLQPPVKTIPFVEPFTSLESDKKIGRLSKGWSQHLASDLLSGLRHVIVVQIKPGPFLWSAGDLNLNVVAMALSGYTDEKSSLWREMCGSLRLQLKNPYLCVMFAFLTSEPGVYDGVLVPHLFVLLFLSVPL